MWAGPCSAVHRGRPAAEEQHCGGRRGAAPAAAGHRGEPASCAGARL